LVKPYLKSGKNWVCLEELELGKTVINPRIIHNIRLKSMVGISVFCWVGVADTWRKTTCTLKMQESGVIERTAMGILTNEWTSRTLRMRVALTGLTIAWIFSRDEAGKDVLLFMIIFSGLPRQESEVSAVTWKKCLQQFFGYQPTLAYRKWVQLQERITSTNKRFE